MLTGKWRSVCILSNSELGLFPSSPFSLFFFLRERRYSRMNSHRVVSCLLSRQNRKEKWGDNWENGAREMINKVVEVEKERPKSCRSGCRDTSVVSFCQVFTDAKVSYGPLFYHDSSGSGSGSIQVYLACISTHWCSEQWPVEYDTPSWVCTSYQEKKKGLYFRVQLLNRLVFWVEKSLNCAN